MGEWALYSFLGFKIPKGGVPMINKIKIALAWTDKVLAVGAILTTAGKALVKLFDKNNK